jgi:aquaporin Z
MNPLLSRALSEGVGTFCLVFFGVGAAATLSVTGSPDAHVATALCFGVVVTVMILLFGDHSGAHLNPAVTSGFILAQRMTLRDGAAYIAGQVAGALLAGFALARILSFFEGAPVNVLEVGVTRPAVPQSVAFGVEALLTCILMFVILRVSTGSKERGTRAAFAIGATVFLCAAAFGPLTGASMNPARSIGPAIALWIRDDLWIYVTAPVVGALAAVPLCRVLAMGVEEPSSDVVDE